MKISVPGTMSRRKIGCRRYPQIKTIFKLQSNLWGKWYLILIKEKSLLLRHWVSGVDLEDTYTVGYDFLQAAFSSLLAVSFPCLTSLWSLDSAANLGELGVFLLLSLKASESAGTPVSFTHFFSFLGWISGSDFCKEREWLLMCLQKLSF